MHDGYIRTTWLSVGLLLAMLTVGYVLAVMLRGDAAIAQPVRCPMQEKTCANGGCANHAACQNGTCSKDCPGNCAQSNRVTE